MCDRGLALRLSIGPQDPDLEQKNTPEKQSAKLIGGWTDQRQRGSGELVGVIAGVGGPAGPESCHK